MMSKKVIAILKSKKGPAAPNHVITWAVNLTEIKDSKIRVNTVYARERINGEAAQSCCNKLQELKCEDGNEYNRFSLTYLF